MFKAICRQLLFWYDNAIAPLTIVAVLWYWLVNR